jgi:NhaA family Na+:H+ antiporter
MPIKMLKRFVQLESAGGIILFVAAALAWLVENSSWHRYYHSILAYKVGFALPLLHLNLSVAHWINDGMMVIFFFLVGLEIKRELLIGELNSLAKCMLPAIAAIGGMAVPAVIFFLFNRHDAVALRGWAIPTATDIAFSLGVLSLLGSRIPLGLKVFLTALAIFDDVGAIIIIACFYTAKLSWLMLAMAAFILAILFLLNRLKVSVLWPYLILGIMLWLCVLQSGVHATISGILLAFTIPLNNTDAMRGSLLQHLEHVLVPWVAFLVLPIFAFTNAGVSLSGMEISHLMSGVTLGIVFGLLVGKPLGITGASYLGAKLFNLRLPAHITWRHIFGMSLIAGIGFTMSLFIGSLAYMNMAGMQPFVRIGVVIGSVSSALCGYLLLLFICKKQQLITI